MGQFCMAVFSREEAGGGGTRQSRSSSSRHLAQAGNHETAKLSSVTK
jgi:hypothetical protein